MLILTRVVGESAMIGNGITISIMSVNGANVRIGITAPKDVPIHREEIYNKLKNQKLEAEILAGLNKKK